jgi:hypothetical protein
MGHLTPPGALRPDVAAPNGHAHSVRHTATALLANGFWPVAIYPPGFVDQRGKTRIGKEPIGQGWGLKRTTLEAINATFRKYPGASLGFRVYDPSTQKCVVGPRADLLSVLETCETVAALNDRTPGLRPGVLSDSTDVRASGRAGR